MGDHIHTPNLPIGIWDPQCPAKSDTLGFAYLKAHSMKRLLHFAYLHPLHPQIVSVADSAPIPVADTDPRIVPVADTAPIPVADTAPMRKSPQALLPDVSNDSTVKGVIPNSTFAYQYPNFLPNLDTSRSESTVKRKLTELHPPCNP